MPIYEYECAKCGEKFELRRGLTDSDSEIKCPKCGTEAPKRIFSSFATGGSTGGTLSQSCAPGGFT